MVKGRGRLKWLEQGRQIPKAGTVTVYRGITGCHNVIYSISLWHQMLP